MEKKLPKWAVTWQIEQEIEPPAVADSEPKPRQLATVTGPEGVVAEKAWLLPWERIGFGPVLLVSEFGSFPTASIRLWRWDTSTWTLLGGTNGGYNPVFLRAHANVVYATAPTLIPEVDTVRVIRSLDMGINWTVGAVPPAVLSDHNYQIRDISISADGSIWIVVQSIDAPRAIYIYKSTDGGDSWSAIVNFSNSDSFFTSGGAAKITTHPEDTRRIALLYRQTSGGVEDYLLKVSTDGGMSWNSYGLGLLGLNFNGSTPSMTWLSIGRLIIYHEFYDGVASTSTVRVGLSDNDGANFNYVQVYNDLRVFGEFATVAFTSNRRGSLFAFAWIDNLSVIKPGFFRSLDSGNTWQKFQGNMTQDNSVVFTIDEPAGIVFDELTGDLIGQFGSGSFLGGQFIGKTIVIRDAENQWSTFEVFSFPGIFVTINAGVSGRYDVLSQLRS